MSDHIGWIRSLFGLALLFAVAIPATAGDVHRAPTRFVAGALDGEPVYAENPVDNSVWSAWAYRHGAEYAIAISVLGTDNVWSEPEFIGLDDGIDQIEPSIEIDSLGTVYVALTSRETGAIELLVRPARYASWSEPLALSDPRIPASSPSLRIVSDRLVIGYVSGSRVVVLDRPLTAAPSDRIGTQGVQEGPDVVDPLGRQLLPPLIRPGEGGPSSTTGSSRDGRGGVEVTTIRPRDPGTDER